MFEIWHPGWHERDDDQQRERDALRILDCPRKMCRRTRRCTGVGGCIGETRHPESAAEWAAVKRHLHVVLEALAGELALDPEGARRTITRAGRAAQARDARAWARARRKLGR